MSRVGISTSPTDDTGTAVLGALLMPMSGAVLLIACLNVANLFLARGTARKKEIAIRMALGGGRRRIVRQLLTEGLALAIVGAVGGLMVGYWTTRLLAASFVSVVPRYSLDFNVSQTPSSFLLSFTNVTPALQANFSLSTPGAIATQIRSSCCSGATSQSALTDGVWLQQSGLVSEIFLDGGWRSISGATSVAAANLTSPLGFAISTPTALQLLTDGATIHLAVHPMGINGSSQAEVVVKDLEVQVDYRFQ